MATTSVQVTVINNSEYGLTKIDENLEGATWVSNAAETIEPGQRAAWQCEASGLLGDTKGWVAYRVGETEQIVMRWDNPSLGEAAYRIDLSDNSPIDADVDGVIGDTAQVTYSLYAAVQGDTADGATDEFGDDEGMIADASFASGGAPEFNEATVGAAMDAEYSDDAAMAEYEDAAVADAGDMPMDTPTRSVKVFFTNNTDLTLVKQEQGLIQGVWVLLPLDMVLPGATVEWQCASEGVQSGAEGYVIYTTNDTAAPLFTIRWNNPYVDVPAYTSETSAGYTVREEGGAGDYAEVSYTLAQA